MGKILFFEHQGFLDEASLFHKRFIEEMEARSWEEISRIADKAALVYPVKAEEPRERGGKLESHHFRYGMRDVLSVVWLCPLCHLAADAKRRSREQGDEVFAWDEESSKG